MPAVEHRPLTGEERRTLSRLRSSREELVHDLFIGGFVFVITYLPLIWVPSFFGASSPTWRWIAFGLAIVTGVGTVVFLGLERRRATRVHAADLEDGRAAVGTYDVTEAVRVEPLEDEGPSYYLALAEGGTLFLRGPYLEEYEASGRFPSTRIRTTRSGATGFLFDLEVLGRPLAPTRTVRAFTLREHEAEEVPDDGTHLPEGIEPLLADRGE